MELSLLLSMLIFLWVAAITPGPNNMLLTVAGAKFGFLNSLSLLAGIMLGMQLMLLLVAFGVGRLILLSPNVHFVLKAGGSAYLLWLAWRIASSPYKKLDVHQTSEKKISLWQGGLLQLVNPKAWLMVLGAVTSFSMTGALFVESILVISLGMLLVNIVAGAIWLGFGTFIGKILRNRHAWQAFNILMGIITAACIVLIWR